MLQPRLPRNGFPLVLAIAAAVLAGVAGCGENREQAGSASPRFTRKPVTMDKLTYPAARVQEQIDDYFGVPVADPYRWLENADSEETHAWVQAQNAVTGAFLEAVPAREAFRKRLTEVWDYARYSAPFIRGGKTFFTKNDGLQNQSVLYVQDSPAGEPRLLLDPNTLSKDGTVSLGETSISKDGRFLAWSTSVSGSDWRTWYIRDIAKGLDLPDEISWSKFSGASWDLDARGFYYSRYDAPPPGETFEGTNYHQKLYYHQTGTSQDQDVLVYERPDQKEWGFDGQISDDGRYLVISIWEGTSRNNRLYYKDLLDKSKRVNPLLDAFDASYQFVGNDGPVFFIQTNLEAPREKLIAIDLGQPDPAAWRTLIPEGEDPIESATVLAGSFVVVTMKDVVNVVKVYDLEGRFGKEIPLPGLGSVSGFDGSPEDTETYFAFNSYLNPGEIYHHDFRTGRSTLFRKPEIAFDFGNYETRQVFFASKDGTRVPMFLVHRRDLILDGENPALLYGYGGFNISLAPRFSPAILPWIEQGGIYAVANLRGGGEYGEQWHLGGMLKNKQNVFDDFIAAAEYLIAEGFTNPDRLAIEGASNGGTLIGAVVNQRPELFGAALPEVGVMDMLRFQLFTIGWAWVSDFGSSDDPEMFPVLYAYSPYHNLKAGTKYPAVMITTADHDDRVVPGHSFKYAAQLQACQSGNLPTLIRIQTKAGHGAGKPTAMVIEEVADQYAFLNRVLKLDGG